MNKFTIIQAADETIHEVSSKVVQQNQMKSCPDFDDACSVSQLAANRKHSLSTYSKSKISINGSSPDRKAILKISEREISTMGKLFPPAIYHQPVVKTKVFCSIVDEYMDKNTIK